MVFYLCNLESSWPKDDMCQICVVEIGPVAPEKKIFDVANVFALFSYYLHIINGKTFHLNKLQNFLHSRMLCAKFGWNWHSGSRAEYENVKS